MEKTYERTPSQSLPEEEASGALRAYRNIHRALQYVNGVVKGKRPPGEEVIKNIHFRCMDGLLFEGSAGEYRRCNIGISRSSMTPPHCERVPELMKDFVDELSRRIGLCSRDINHLPTVIKTITFAHYGFVRIHPFEDGNGRTVRLLCDLIAKRFHLRPIIVWPPERETYIQALEAVNRSANLAHLELFLIERLMERYQDVKRGHNREIFAQLRRLAQEKRRAIRTQSEPGDFEEIWPVLKRPCFD